MTGPEHYKAAAYVAWLVMFAIVAWFIPFWAAVSVGILMGLGVALFEHSMRGGIR